MSTNNDVMVSIDHLYKSYGKETAVKDFNIQIAQGEFVTLLGPSGCGKTTTLRCVAGLERPEAGEIRIGNNTVVAPEKDIFLYPEHRNIGMVFQSYAVWPHMTVFDNCAYGLRVRRASSDVIKRQTMLALELVGLDHLADRFATKLSGGQRQRVALARAIVYQPEVILFDEPLSNLDAKLREQMRDEIVRLQKEVGITSIFVTHDQSEALVMSDRVVVMDKAVIQQVGDPQEIYANPANSFVANFIGVTSLLEGKLLHFKRMQAAIIGNLIEGQVIDTIYLGSFLEGRVQVGPHEIGIQIDHFENLASGQTVYLSFQPEHGLCLAN